MAFKLHGYNISTCTRRVAQIARERNIPYELVSVDLPTGEHKQQAHVAHQPFGQVPYITVRRPSFHHTPSIYVLGVRSLTTWLSSKTMASSSSSRALSVDTLRRSGPART